MREKSLVDLSWQVSEEEYRADSAYSYSCIAKYCRGGYDSIGSLFEKVSTPSLIFGSAVDTLVTEGKDAFESKYMVLKYSVPQSMGKVIDYLFDKCSEEYHDLSDIPESTVEEAVLETDYQPNWKLGTRVKSILEKGGGYYYLKQTSKGKILLDEDMYNAAIACDQALKSDPATEWYFRDNTDEVERFYQLKFKGEYNGIPLRCMVDLLVVDHVNKKIYLCDLKTSSHREWDFHKSFMQWSYYIQAQLYWYLVRQNLDKDPVYKEYTLEDCRFIVINKDDLKPLVWEFKGTRSEEDIVTGKSGEYVMRNWRGLVTELNYYLSDMPKYPIGIQEQNDIMEWLNK